MSDIPSRKRFNSSALLLDIPLCRLLLNQLRGMLCGGFIICERFRLSLAVRADATKAHSDIQSVCRNLPELARLFIGELEVTSFVGSCGCLRRRFFFGRIACLGF